MKARENPANAGFSFFAQLAETKFALQAPLAEMRFALQEFCLLCAILSVAGGSDMVLALKGACKVGGIWKAAGKRNFQNGQPGGPKQSRRLFQTKPNQILRKARSGQLRKQSHKMAVAVATVGGCLCDMDWLRVMFINIADNASE